MSGTEAMELLRSQERWTVFCLSQETRLYSLSMQSHPLPYYDKR